MGRGGLRDASNARVETTGLRVRRRSKSNDNPERAARLGWGCSSCGVLLVAYAIEVRGCFFVVHPRPNRHPSLPGRR